MTRHAGGLTRRELIVWGSGAATGLFLTSRLGIVKVLGTAPAGAETLPGGTLDPTAVPKYLTPLLVPPVMPRSGTALRPGVGLVDEYEISVRQLSQQILPLPLPPTTVWGYGPLRSASRRGVLLHNAPSLTIEALWNRPVRVTWVNELVDEAGRYLPHLLPVDPTLHWANPPGGQMGRDTRPVFEETPGPYRGPVPMVPHVHGSVGVGDDSDGYAEAWWLPAAADIPDGYATEGTWYDFFAAKAAARFGASWGPGYAVFEYPAGQRAGTLWYHDHTLGMTRLNVYAGPAGFYLIRGGPGGDGAVLDARTGAVATLPGPAPRAGDRFPPNKPYREIPLAVQDRSFNADGSLFYPDTRAFFDGITGPFLPTTDISPIWNPEFFGNTIMVNGATWPFLTVEQRRYRFRALNGCQSRFLILDFGDLPGVRVWQIGNEGGFLRRPVDLTALGNRLLMGPAERADLVVDFGGVPLGSFVLRNVGPDEPFSGGEPPDAFDLADPATTGQVLQLRVVPSTEPDPTTPPEHLVLPPLAPLPPATVIRTVALLEQMSESFEDAPAETRLGTVAFEVDGTGTWTPLAWMDEVTENPELGATEVWELYNATADTHPMHIHEVMFEVVDRQAIEVDEMARAVRVVPGSVPRPPEPWEDGRKDTVIAFPGEVTRVRMTFGTAGQYVWHCHIVEHEDNEMMRPYRIGPEQPGQPMPHGTHPA